MGRTVVAGLAAAVLAINASVVPVAQAVKRRCGGNDFDSGVTS